MTDRPPVLTTKHRVRDRSERGLRGALDRTRLAIASDDGRSSAIIPFTEALMWLRQLWLWHMREVGGPETLTEMCIGTPEGETFLAVLWALGLVTYSGEVEAIVNQPAGAHLSGSTIGVIEASVVWEETSDLPSYQKEHKLNRQGEQYYRSHVASKGVDRGSGNCPSVRSRTQPARAGLYPNRRRLDVAPQALTQGRIRQPVLWAVPPLEGTPTQVPRPNPGSSLSYRQETGDVEVSSHA